MVRSFMQTRDLQNLAIVLCHVSQPLEEQFYRDQALQCKGAFMEWAVERAWGQDHWWATVCNTLKASFSTTLAERLGQTPAAASTQERAEGIAPWMVQEAEILGKAFHFASHVASYHLWGHLQYHWVLPHALPAYLISDPQQRTTQVASLAGLVKAVSAAEKLEKNSAKLPEALQRLMRDIGWNRQQLAREAMAYMTQTGFDPNAQALRELASKICGASHSTWGVMESAFSYLQYRVASQTTNEKMADYTRFAYALLNPFAESAGLPQVLPAVKDWLELFSPGMADVRARATAELTSVNSTTMPSPVDQNEHEMLDRTTKLQWKASGPLSHQKSAAAGIYLATHLDSQWEDVGRAWTCVSAFSRLKLSLFSLSLSRKAHLPCCYF